LRIARVAAAGATAWPSRQPVQLNVLLSPEIVTVRSRIPGHAANAWWCPA
jgi:hypothetical protein